MSALSKIWSNETAPKKTHICQCCNKPTQIAGGIIRDQQKKDVAMYVEYMCPTTKPRKVFLFLHVRRDNHRDHIVSLVLQRLGGNIVTTVFTDTHNPLGQSMSREEVLASPLKPFIFEIVDWIVENDPHVGPFLDDDSTGDVAEGTTPTDM
jgi:hypothetical protein